MSKVKQQPDLKNKADLRNRSYCFSLAIIKFVNNLPNKKIYWSISDQLLRAGTSIGANIIEAKASSSRRDFIHFYEIALKSANETIYWLYLIKDSQLAEGSSFQNLITEAKEIANMLGSSLLTLKRK